METHTRGRGLGSRCWRLGPCQRRQDRCRPVSGRAGHRNVPQAGRGDCRRSNGWTGGSHHGHAVRVGDGTMRLIGRGGWGCVSPVVVILVGWLWVIVRIVSLKWRGKLSRVSEVGNKGGSDGLQRKKRKGRLGCVVEKLLACWRASDWRGGWRRGGEGRIR